jgi:hypothetical protein
VNPQAYALLGVTALTAVLVAVVAWAFSGSFPPPEIRIIDFATPESLRCWPLPSRKGFRNCARRSAP